MIQYLIVGGAAIGQTLFCLVYTLLPWWRSEVGRALYFKAITLGILTDTVALEVFFFGEFPEIVTLMLYGAVAVAIWIQLIVLIRVRLKAKQDEVSTIS